MESGNGKRNGNGKRKQKLKKKTKNGKRKIGNEMEALAFARGLVYNNARASYSAI